MGIQRTRLNDTLNPSSLPMTITSTPPGKSHAASILLAHVRELIGHRRELLRATGEHFNIFQILGVGHYEVSTHSAMLCNLLSPSGSHGQGAAFLKCFIAVLGLDGAFDADSACVKPEASIGRRTDTAGGRLDILITDKAGGKIAIENKIHADEQDNWVRRYLNGLRPNGQLIYLTLDGSNPKQMAETDRGKVMCISYASAIVKWLEECRKEVATVPIVREGLTQYIHLIQHLTNQNTSNRMTEEIVKSVLETPGSFDAFCAMRDTENAVKGRIVCDFAERVRSKIPEEFELISTPKGNCEAYDGFAFSTPDLKARNLNAVVSFDSKQYGNCFVGFELLNRDELIVEPSKEWKVLTEKFKAKINKVASSGRWPAWTQWTIHPHWGDNDTLRMIKFEGSRQFEEEFISVVSDLLEVAKAFAREVDQ